MSRHDDGYFRGVIFGALVGGLAALLLAPKSGRETRKDIQGRLGEFRDDTERRISELGQDISQRTDKLKSAAKDLAGEAKQESEGLIERAEQLTSELKMASGNLAVTGKAAKDQALADIKPLIGEGADVMKELERVTRKLASSAKNKLSSEDSGQEEQGI